MDEHGDDRQAAAAQAVRPRHHGHRDSRSSTAAPAARCSTPCWRSRRCRGSIRPSACWSTCRTRWSSTPIVRWGNADLKQRYLTRLAGGTIGAFCLSEAGSGSDAFALTTRAVDDGDAYALTGRKLWITNANEADVFIVFATVNPDAGYKGITAFMVERGTPGFSVGKKEDKLGIRASSTCELLFDDCRVPKANVLGEVGKGYKVAIETLNEGRIGIGAQMLGLAQGALDHTVAYVKEREQFGKAIAEFQGVQFQLARMACDVEIARLLTYNAARLRDAGQPFLQEAAICKLVTSEVAERVASQAINLFGGYGFVKDYPVEKLYRDAKIGQIYEGHVATCSWRPSPSTAWRKGRPRMSTDGDAAGHRHDLRRAARTPCSGRVGAAAGRAAR